MCPAFSLLTAEALVPIMPNRATPKSRCVLAMISHACMPVRLELLGCILRWCTLSNAHCDSATDNRAGAPSGDGITSFKSRFMRHRQLQQPFGSESHPNLLTYVWMTISIAAWCGPRLRCRLLWTSEPHSAAHVKVHLQPPSTTSSPLKATCCLYDRDAMFM